MKSLPPELQEVYQRHYTNSSQPGYDELEAVLLATIQRFDRIFFVVDALDECPPDERMHLLKFCFSIATPTGTSPGTVKIFITSRRENDINRAFQQRSIPTIEIEAATVDSDISIYVKAQIEQRLQDGRLVLKDLALKEKLLSVLTTKAGGMCVSL